MNGKKVMLCFAMLKPKLTNILEQARSGLLFLLFPLEYLYRLLFFIDQTIKKYRTPETPYPFKVISVGNLTVGGTGKSVVVPFLVKTLGVECCAVVMRGYGGAQERANKPMLVSDGKQLFCSVAVAGDEAVMHATHLACPVVVSASRQHGCNLIRGLFCTALPPLSVRPSASSGGAVQSTQYVILDDAYQHHSVKKDLEIVLLDARKPFDNGHCLPLGRLREKDLSRASLVMLTHSDQISTEQREVLELQLQKQLGTKPIFWGKHAIDGLYQNNEELVSPAFFADKKIVIVAGIGKPVNIEQSLKKINLIASAVCAFPNHAPYRERDLETICEQAQAVGATAVITTTKDWVKLAPLVLRQYARAPLSWYVLRVQYELLDKPDDARLRQQFN